MARFLHHSLKVARRNWTGFILALSWVLGLIAGCILCLSADISDFSLMRMAPCRPVSIIRLLAVVLLPFLFSGFAVSISQTWLLIPVAFMKSLIFAAVSTAILLSFGSAGWLMSFLLMFSSVCTMPVLIFYWLRYIPKGKAVALQDVFIIISVILVVCGIDFYFISPVLAGL